MARAVLVLDVVVVTALLILIPDEDRDAGARRLALEHARQDFRQVRLLALRHEVALPWAAPAEIDGEVLHRERDTRRAAVDDHDVAGAVRFPSRGDAKGLTEAISRHLALEFRT